MSNLPENWNEMSLREKDLYFARRYLNYTHQGEADGLREDAPDDVKEAYEQFLKEKER